jgi:hypothetical protein
MISPASSLGCEQEADSAGEVNCEVIPAAAHAAPRRSSGATSPPNAPRSELWTLQRHMWPAFSSAAAPNDV